MPVAALGFIVLAGLLFAVWTVVSYFERVTPLRTEAETLQGAVEAKKARIEDLQHQMETMKNAQPQLERRAIRLRQWIDRLKAQLSRLEALEKRKGQAGSVEQEVMASRAGARR